MASSGRGLVISLSCCGRVRFAFTHIVLNYSRTRIRCKSELPQTFTSGFSVLISPGPLDVLVHLAQLDLSNDTHIKLHVVAFLHLLCNVYSCTSNLQHLHDAPDVEVLHTYTFTLDHVLHVVSLSANEHVEGIAAPTVVATVTHYFMRGESVPGVQLVDNAIDVVVTLVYHYTWAVLTTCA